MSLHTTSPKIKAIKARIITTDDYNLIGKIIVKNGISLGNLIPRCVTGTKTVENVANYVKNSMQPGKKINFDVHGVQSDLDYARNMMISGYEQVELIESAWNQFATILHYEQIINNFKIIKSDIDKIYNVATQTPSISDTKQALWDYDQVESDEDIQKYGAFLLSSIYDSLHKYIFLINLYGGLSKNSLVGSSYINGVLNYIANENLRMDVTANQPRRNRFLPAVLDKYR
jgi:hypothetical protein